MEPGASNSPPDPYKGLLFVASWWRGLVALLSQCVSFSLIDVALQSFVKTKRLLNGTSWHHVRAMGGATSTNGPPGL
eukprot:1156232-Pelagomonas_calceolata.AAC.1